MRRSHSAALLLAGALTLTACGGGDEPATTSGTSAKTFEGVTVSNPTDLSRKPTATSSATRTPATLEFKDLVVGTGAKATSSSTVNVQYEGLLYRDGHGFDASWDRGGPTSFSLQQVVPGFTQGIGGTTGVPPMQVGGRRIMILPPALGYPQGTPDGSIPANAPIVFVVDLISLS